MLVWHINFVADLWEANQVNSGLQHIDLIEADAILSESTRAGDAFPGTAGVTSFTSETHPAMLTATGEPVDMPLTEIEERNGIIYFKAGDGHVSLEQVTVLPAARRDPRVIHRTLGAGRRCRSLQTRRVHPRRRWLQLRRRLPEPHRILHITARRRSRPADSLQL